MSSLQENYETKRDEMNSETRTDDRFPMMAVTNSAEWPCSNCHTLVHSFDTRCPSCGGIQTRISSESFKNNRHLMVHCILDLTTTESRDSLDSKKEDYSCEGSLTTEADHDEENRRPNDPVALLLEAAQSSTVTDEDLEEPPYEPVIPRHIYDEKLADYHRFSFQKRKVFRRYRMSKMESMMYRQPTGKMSRRGSGTCRPLSRMCKRQAMNQPTNPSPNKRMKKD